MRKVVLITLLCCATLFYSALAANDSAKSSSQPKQDMQPMSFSAQSTIESAKAPANAATSSQAPAPKGSLTILKQDSGKNLSEMNFTMYSVVGDFGFAGINVGEVVKFTAPRPGWMLKALQIVGWSGFNNTTKLFPPDRDFLIEVRDKDANLLYKFADDQNMYFASTAGPVIRGIDIPALPVTGDFYVIFYDRGSMSIGMEQGNGTGNSYLVINGHLIPAEFKVGNTNETTKVNWLIRAVGE